MNVLSGATRATQARHQGKEGDIRPEAWKMALGTNHVMTGERKSHVTLNASRVLTAARHPSLAPTSNKQTETDRQTSQPASRASYNVAGWTSVGR